MNLPERFTYPFCYAPHPLVREAAEKLVDSFDRSLLEEGGKMFGVLLATGSDGVIHTLYGFSGLLCGKAVIPGFVPPILDWSAVDGYFRRREKEISAMPEGKEKSKASAELQDWLFSNYIVSNARGERASIKEIFALRGLVPPGGTGECAAPKLLQHAYAKGLKPRAMGEFWLGPSSAAEVRAQGRFYPSCTGKCGPLLEWMMRGLDVDPNPLEQPYHGPVEPRVIYEDETVIVVDKPGGMLSVPGRTGVDSLLDWLSQRYGVVHSCHRLDMDTSGVMVYSRNTEAKAAIEAQFADRSVRKTYRALLVPGQFKRAKKGTIALPLALDYYDRPRQVIDRENGKKAVTEYEVLSVLPSGERDVRFTPHTGRSHQIRVHAAHADGLGLPICGDKLYGDARGLQADGIKGLAGSFAPLCLRAESLEFTHPATGERMHFESDPDWSATSPDDATASERA